MTDDAVFYTSFPSAIGELLLTGNARGLQSIRLLERTPDNAVAGLHPVGTRTRLDGFFDSARAAITHYLAHGGALNLPYHFTGGTPLQRAVWLELTRIPYGTTISYTTLAERVGFPRAVRAVASACGANPLPLVIPCHRVVAKDGTLGGFSLGGLHVKEQLLAVEAASSAAAA